MNNVIYVLIFLLGFTNAVNSQIPNNGFENWTSFGNYSTPDNWETLNTVTAPAAVFTCVKGIPGNPGNAYLRMTSRSVPGMGMQPGIAVSGKLNTSTFMAESGFAYTSRPAELKGNWQYMAYGADQGYIAVYLTKWNTGLNRRDTIGKILYLLPGMVMSWQAFTLPITYLSSGNPDSAMIILSASGANPVYPSFLYVDNLVFNGGTAGKVDLANQSLIRIYPNPVVTGILRIGMEHSLISPTSADILDQQGVVIQRTPFIRNFPFSIDVSGLSPGVYILKLNSASGHTCSRFIKQ
jgi:hypothetical protein